MPDWFFVEIQGVFFGDGGVRIVQGGDSTAVMLSFDDF